MNESQITKAYKKYEKWTSEKFYCCHCKETVPYIEKCILILCKDQKCDYALCKKCFLERITTEEYPYFECKQKGQLLCHECDFRSRAIYEINNQLVAAPKDKRSELGKKNKNILY